MTPCVRIPTPPGEQRGFSLVEFMVAMTISLLVVAAASAVYLNSSQTQRALTERQNLFEGARVAMDIIGRDLENAGYFPSELTPLTGAVTVPGFGHPCENPDPNFKLPATPVTADLDKSLCDFAPPPAFGAPVFGCTGERLLRAGTAATTSYACSALPTEITTTEDVDSLVVNYFTADAGSLQIGQRGDCEGQDVAKDAINTRNLVQPVPPQSKPNRLTYLNAMPATYSGIAPTLQPRLPLFVSNRYTLVPSVETVQGQTVNTRSLACDGNGNDNDGSSAAASTAQPIVAGIRQLKFHYYQQDGSGNGQYWPSSGVTDWNAVVAVRVCVFAESIQTVANVQEPVVDCNGVDQTFGDNRARKMFTQVFALKNRLGAQF